MCISKRNRLFVSILAASFVALFFVDAGASPEDAEIGWDGEVATKLAIDLEQTLDEAYERSLKAPPQRTALQQRERDAAQGVIRRARDLGREYASKMRAGWSRNETEAYFRNVVEEVANIWETSGDAVPAISAKPLIKRLNRILDELQALYDASQQPD
jgi:hypothetical protein